MCVPVSADELHSAVVEMDVDGNGLIDIAEFTQFFVSLGFDDDSNQEAAKSKYEDSDDSEVCHNVADAEPPRGWPCKRTGPHIFCCCVVVVCSGRRDRRCADPVTGMSALHWTCCRIVVVA